MLNSIEEEKEAVVRIPYLANAKIKRFEVDIESFLSSQNQISILL